MVISELTTEILSFVNVFFIISVSIKWTIWAIM